MVNYIYDFFYFITVNGGESELIFTIKELSTGYYESYVFSDFFFTIRWIIILSKSNSKSDWF